ncbi:MAG: TonB-dependent receptor plug domain-containing protein [Longimicrobiales bacterium]
MNVFHGSGSVLHPPWVLCAITLVYLTGCATTPSAREPEASDDNTVDIGYGSVGKDHVVGSVTTLRDEDLQTERYRTLADMLAQVPGVRVVDQPDGGMSVRIRGTSSLLGGQEPLFVMDGMMIHSADGGLLSISPTNIKSITVLKDAGATAIYGSRGANGVILIRTKGG